MDLAGAQVERICISQMIKIDLIAFVWSLASEGTSASFDVPRVS